MAKDNSPFIWDKYSDQPYPIKDKTYKKQKRGENLFDYLPLIIYNLFIFPLAIFFSFLFKAKKNKFSHFFGMCINLDKGKEQLELINELDIDELQIRMPLAKIDKIDEYVKFAKEFKNKRILINILQDREYIDDKEKLGKVIILIFSKFKGISNFYQIGNAINRTKWGFFSIKEYMEFYEIVQNIRDRDFKDYILVGPSIIDFEYHYTVRALFNNFSIKYDKLSSLLYVDRRGAPENTQMLIFNTSRKIDFLYSLGTLSKKSSRDILLTEANWPISNTSPWAPTSEKECVNEDDYTNYMLRYYFLALASKKVETVYWHQLIAPGYGLIDTRDGFRKREAFEAFKFMVKILKNTQVKGFYNLNDYYVLICSVENKDLEIIWNNTDKVIKLNDFAIVFDRFGQELTEAVISKNPIYVYKE